MADLNPDEQRLLDDWLADLDADKQLERDMADFGLVPRRYRRGWTTAPTPTALAATHLARFEPRPAAPPRPPQRGSAASALVAWLMELPHDTDRPHESRTRNWAEAVATGWGKQGFTPKQVQRWISVAGLAPGEFRLAYDLARHDITPHHASAVIRGDTILYRIRQRRLTLPQAVYVLREAGLMRPSA